MLMLEKIVDTPQHCEAELCLPFEQRCKSRLRAILEDGREVGLVLPRGHVLRGGDCLASGEGVTVRIRAANEQVTTAHSSDPHLLCRAAYHLGNRHVPLQLGEGWLRYQHDHVLDEMLVLLGLEVMSEQAPFEPEAGAYAGGGHGHHHN